MKLKGLSKKDLKNAIIMKEILSKPVSIRNQGESNSVKRINS